MVGSITLPMNRIGPVPGYDKTYSVMSSSYHDNLTPTQELYYDGDPRMILKMMIAGAILACVVGLGSIGYLGARGIADDIWEGRGGGCRGGGPYGGYGWDGDGSPCHGEFDGNEEYCPYHEEYFSEEEWEDHQDDCPMDE